MLPEAGSGPPVFSRVADMKRYAKFNAWHQALPVFYCSLKPANVHMLSIYTRALKAESGVTQR